jgi:hypothetical protein
MRRIRNVSLTIPCVAGPYSSVSCTLTLLKSSVRRDSSIESTYQRDTENDTDPRFKDTFGPIQSIVTSTAQQDSGLFEPNLRDERYLPFEGSGALAPGGCRCRPQFRQFDYATIADVILYVYGHLAEPLKNACVSKRSRAKCDQRASNETGLVRLFSLNRISFTMASSHKRCDSRV